MSERVGGQGSRVMGQWRAKKTLMRLKNETKQVN